MSSKKKRRPPNRPPCRELGSDDGIDPRYYFRNTADRSGKPDRKTLQLCAQVARAVRWALLSAVGDERLQALDVLRVEPAPDARRLRVFLCPRNGRLSAMRGLDACLERAGPRLRQAISQAIHRRRTPELVFEVRPDEGRPS